MSNPSESRIRRRSGLLRFFDRLTHFFAFAGAATLIALLVILLAFVIDGAYPAIKQYGFHFLFSSAWNPNETPSSPMNFGAWPFIYSTLVTSLVALLIAFPISLGSAIFVTKLAPKIRIPIPARLLRRQSPSGWIAYAPRHLVSTVSFLIELLAAIPSIAYGLWGLIVLVPFMQTYLQPFLAQTIDLHILPGHFLPHWRVGLMLSHWPLIGSLFIRPASGLNIFSASIILAVMVTPIITAVIRDVLAVAPPELEQGALGLGATWWQSMKLVIGFSKMGIFGAVILGFARATGETMAVTMLIGNANPLNHSLFASGNTIASKLASQFNNADPGSLELQSLVFLALILLVMTTFTNGVARVILLRVAAGKKRK